MEKLHFKICVEGEIMSQETLHFTITVNPVAKPLTLVDANGNPLADGDSVTLQPQTVGVADPGQVLFTVSGGAPPYTFSVSAGAIPDGDTLSSTVNPDTSETVTIEGTPTTAGASTFDVTVADSAGATTKATVKKPVA